MCDNNRQGEECFLPDVFRSNHKVKEVNEPIKHANVCVIDAINALVGHRVFCNIGDIITLQAILEHKRWTQTLLELIKFKSIKVPFVDDGQDTYGTGWLPYCDIDGTKLFCTLRLA